MAYMTFDYRSAAQVKYTSIRAYLPDAKVSGLDAEPLKTVYFLSGFATNGMEVATYLRIRRESELKNLAIIIVDGENKFYLDHPERRQNYSTFVGKEIVEVTRRMFPLSTRREDTYIAGISMGGYGALYNGLKYRDTFSRIAAFSPAVDAFRTLEEATADFTIPQLEDIFGRKDEYLASEWNLKKYYQDTIREIRSADIPSKPDDGQAHARCAQGEKAENLPDIFICCGEQDRAVHPQGKEFAQYIKSLGYNCEYRGGDGDHEIDYWEKLLDPAFSFLAGIPEGTKNDMRKMMAG